MLKQHSKLSVIIPILNEERTIGSIIEIFRTWGKAIEIIVVDDGSTDRSLQALHQFGKTIRVISYGTNRGKGYALSRGIVESHGELIMFFDGDVVGLTHRDLDAMIYPMLTEKADMTLGVARFWGAGSFEPFNDITGLRVLWRKNIIEFVGKIQKLGYGVELYVNDLHKNKSVVSVRLPHVFILGKLEKQNIPDAMLSYIGEASELLSQFVVSHAKDITPSTKRVLRTLQMYLLSAVEIFR